MLRCPFCDAEESDRIDLEDKRFVVFPCAFTPEVDAGASEESVQRALAEMARTGGAAYFRGTCDRLHRYVTAGPGDRILRGRATTPAAGPTE